MSPLPLLVSRAVDQDNLSILGQVDTILVGSRTYRLFVDSWPTAEGALMAELVTSTPKVVFSSVLDRGPWGPWEPAQVDKGGAVDDVRPLRREPGRDVMVGHGRTLLTEDSGRLDLTLLEAKPYASGIVSLRYAVTRS